MPTPRDASGITTQTDRDPQPQTPTPGNRTMAEQTAATHETTVKVESNTLGTAGFVTSLVGWVTCGVLCPIGLLLSVIALFKAPRGMAIAGTIIGGLGSLFVAFVATVGIGTIA